MSTTHEHRWTVWSDDSKPLAEGVDAEEVESWLKEDATGTVYAECEDCQALMDTPGEVKGGDDEDEDWRDMGDEADSDN
jgi:hypothetical protein